MTTPPRNACGIRPRIGKDTLARYVAHSPNRWSLPLPIRARDLSAWPLTSTRADSSNVICSKQTMRDIGSITQNSNVWRPRNSKPSPGDIRNEGWKWVEIHPTAQYPDLSNYSRIHPVYVPVTDEIRAQIEALQAEQEKIENDHEHCEEYPPDIDKRMAEIETLIEELNDQPGKYSEEEIPLAGALVCLESHGRTAIHRGLVRPEDKRK